MKKETIVLIAVISVVAIIIFSFIGTYNSLVSKREAVDEKLSSIDVALERRANLIPNLVNTVKGYAAHEQEAIKAVSDARTKYASSGTAEEKAEADAQMTSAISRLLMVAENYPDLKADANFRQLSYELSGAENRISVARHDYNSAAKEYNTKIAKFPANIIAGMFGFEKATYFEAAEGSQAVPEVNF